MAIKAIVNNVEKEIIDVKMISGGNELNAWEVRDQQNRLIWGKEGTISGQTPLSFKAGGVPLTGMTLYGNTVQNGTPTPTNPITPEGVGLNGTIPITCGGQTSTIQLSQKQSTRRIKKFVFTGNENWDTQPNVYINNTALFSLQQTTIGKMTNRPSLNTHFITAASGVNPQRENYVCSGYHPADGYSDYYYIRLDFSTIGITSETTGADAIVAFKAWLRQQYQNGTPITIWCAMATSQTAIVNEPLMKIGNYADTITMTQAGIEIPTIQGENTLTVGTTIQPSSITISGHII